MADQSYSVDTGRDLIAGTSLVTAHLYFESGQSNCQGTGEIADAPAGSNPGPIAGVFTYRRSTDLFTGAGSWQPLTYANNQYLTRNEFGSILSFAIAAVSEYYTEGEQEIYIIKADSNGVPISNWDVGQPEWGATVYHIQSGIQALIDDPTIGKIIVHQFNWDQGESDALNSTTANAYESNLGSDLIPRLRALVGTQNLPFVLRPLDASVSSVPLPFASTVSAAQSAVAAADPLIDAITTSFAFQPDNIHLEGTAYNLYGQQRFASSETFTPITLWSAR